MPPADTRHHSCSLSIDSFFTILFEPAMTIISSAWRFALEKVSRSLGWHTYSLHAYRARPIFVRLEADRVADFPAAAASGSLGLRAPGHEKDGLSLCFSPHRPPRQAGIFYHNHTGVRRNYTGQEHTGLELHFMAHGKTTTVEMREDAIGVPMLSSEISDHH